MGIIIASIVGVLIYDIMLLALLAVVWPKQLQDSPLFSLTFVFPFIAPLIVSAVSRSGITRGVIIGLLTILLGLGSSFLITQAVFARVAEPALFLIIAPYSVPVGLIGGALGGFIGKPPIGVLEWVIVRAIAAAVAGALVYNMPYLLGLIWPDPEEVLGSLWWLVYFIRPIVTALLVFVLTRANIVKLGLSMGLKGVVAIATIGVFTILLGIGLSIPLLILLTMITGEALAFGIIVELFYSPYAILLAVVSIVIAAIITRKIF